MTRQSLTFRLSGVFTSTAGSEHGEVGIRYDRTSPYSVVVIIKRPAGILVRHVDREGLVEGIDKGLWGRPPLDEHERLIVSAPRNVGYVHLVLMEQVPEGLRELTITVNKQQLADVLLATRELVPDGEQSKNQDWVTSTKFLRTAS